MAVVCQPLQLSPLCQASSRRQGGHSLCSASLSWIPALARPRALLAGGSRYSWQVPLTEGGRLLHFSNEELRSEFCRRIYLGEGNHQRRTASIRVASVPACLEESPSIVVTREQGKNEKLINALKEQGLHCLELPLIEHREGPDREALPRLLQEEDFEWIVVTSPEAATVFLSGWREAGSPRLRLAVVGAGTGQMFEGCGDGLDIAFTPSKATAKVLATELPRIEGASGKVLYPASVKAGADLEYGLRERGFTVIRLNTYSTETVKTVERHLMEAAAAAPVVTFASPSAVKAWMELVAKNSSWDGAAACIGSTSAEAALKAGLTKVFYPDSPGIEGWVSSVLDALHAAGRVASSTEAVR